ncbi:unnamed protein product [Lymnaea stagnalis]|uniref:NXPE C-terminal domain-containing protein n=1 Tax=Lymnaea stagnalis TaxID=6523 RepID=A0AAV2IQH6_LYMST
MRSRLVKRLSIRWFLTFLAIALVTTLAGRMAMDAFDVGVVLDDLWPGQPSTYVQRHAGHHRCSLDQMLEGQWLVGSYTPLEMEEVEAFIRRTRDYHSLPATLQRDDNKCGNVNFPDHQWHRAVCNPKGATPCCMDNVCVNKTVQECVCPECYDMRQSVHAEFATWIPENSTCKLEQFKTEEDACRVLQNKTVYFIGDSFMRQLYTSLLAVLRDKKPRHVLRHDVSEAEVHKCDKYYRYFADCRTNLIWNTQECKGTVTLKMEYVSKYQHSIMRLMKDLRGKNDSWFIIGLGSHYFFDFEQVRDNILNRMLNRLSPWPRVIWMAAQAPGTLKTPLEKRQQTPALLSFNEKVKAVLEGRGVAILNYFQLTNGTVSYDGTHYGKGVNDAKLQVLLNFLKGETI